MYQKLLVPALCTGLVTAMSVSAVQVTFDFENQPTGGTWGGTAGQTVGEFTLEGGPGDTAQQAIIGIKRAPSQTDIYYQGGFLFPHGDGAADGDGAVTIKDGTGEVRPFVLLSIDIETQLDDATYEGRLDGAVQWTIVPHTNGAVTQVMPTYTSATAGDLSLPINEVHVTHTENNWENRFDDLVVEILPSLDASVTIADVSIDDVQGVRFSSLAGNTYPLQYSIDGTTYAYAGAYARGNGSEKVLVDPATNTAGRTYRVLGGVFAAFDWSEVPNADWWDHYGYTETDNGITLVSGGRSAAHGGADGFGGLGFAYKAAYPQDATNGTFTVTVGGATRDFAVASIEMSANDAGGEFAPMVQGVQGGVEQWSIVPPGDSTVNTYTTPTTGDMALLIDEMVWTTGVSTNPGAVFDNSIHSLTIALNPLAPVSSSPVTLVDAVVVEAVPFFVEGDTEIKSSVNLAGGTWQGSGDTVVEPGRDIVRYVDPDSGAARDNYAVETAGTAYFFDDFEEADMGWTADGTAGTTQWEMGQPNTSNGFVQIQNAASGVNCWGTNLDGDYAAGTDITLTSPSISLAGAVWSVVEWKERVDIDDTEPEVDEGILYLIDMDAGTTNQVRSIRGADAQGWTEHSFWVPESALGHSIKLQFRLADDGVTSYDWGGWYIDDVRVRN